MRRDAVHIETQPQRHRRRCDAWSVFALAFALRTALLLISDNDDLDAPARLAFSRQVAEGASWVPTWIWLPGHFWLLAIPVACGLRDAIWARLLTAIAGAATSPVAYLLARAGFGRTAGLASALTLALAPLHVRYSLLTMSEAWLVLFSLSAVLGFTRWLALGGVRRLAGGAGALNLACIVRPEAWLLVPLLPALALVGAGPRPHLPRHVIRRRALLFGGCSACMLAWWLAREWMIAGDPLRIVRVGSTGLLTIPLAERPGSLQKMIAWPLMLLVAMGPLAFTGGMRGLIVGRRRFLPSLTLVILGAQAAHVAWFGQLPWPRYALFLMSFVALLVGVPRTPRWVRAPAAMLLAGVFWLVLVGAVAIAPLGRLAERASAFAPFPRVAADVRRLDECLRGAPPSRCS